MARRSTRAPDLKSKPKQDWTRHLPTRTLSLAPKLRLVPQFLTCKELSGLLLYASTKADFERSQVDVRENVQQLVHYRSSASAPLKDGALVRRVLGRVADMLSEFPSHCEPPQLVRYGQGEQYDVHHDAGTVVRVAGDDLSSRFDPSAENFRIEAAPGFKRSFTCLIYLTDQATEEGGGTWFPMLDLIVQPQAGAALFWPNYTQEGELDPDMLHAGQPLLSGSKLAVNVWIGDKSFS